MWLKCESPGRYDEKVSGHEQASTSANNVDETTGGIGDMDIAVHAIRSSKMQASFQTLAPLSDGVVEVTVTEVKP